MIAFLASLIVLDGWLFWAFIVLSSGSALVSCKQDSGGATVFASIVIALFLLLFGHQIFLALGMKRSLIVVISYFLGGILWSFFRWDRHVSRCKKEYLGNKENKRYAWELLHQNTKLSYHKDNVYRWVVYWPFSIIVFILGDGFEYVYRSFSKVYTSITDMHLKDLQPPTTS